jgi:hypothetical protein
MARAPASNDESVAGRVFWPRRSCSDKALLSARSLEEQVFPAPPTFLALAQIVDLVMR